MKVHLYGNTLNNSYNLTIFLRSKGIDAEMFLDESSPYQQDYPWWEDSSLSIDNLPSWIHYYKVKPQFLFPQPELKRLINDFSKCDVALVGGWGPIIAQRAGVPFLFYSCGFDLNIIDIWDNCLGLIRNVMRFRPPRGAKSILLYGFLQRRALYKADRIGILMGYQIKPYIVKFGLIDKMRKVLLAWDVERYRVKGASPLESQYSKYDMVFFMIARHSWSSIWNDIKGNDKFLRAYARFIKDKRPNVRLITIDKGVDVERSKKLIADLGIGDYVEWVKEMNKDGIRSYISLNNVVVVDQFWHDEWRKKFPAEDEMLRMAFGSGALEALSAGKPLLTAFSDEDFYDGNFPPILAAFTEAEIYQRLVEAFEMGAAGRKALGEKAYQFVSKYNGWQNSVDTYIRILQEILKERSLRRS